MVSAKPLDMDGAAALYRPDRGPTINQMMASPVLQWYAAR